MDLDLSHTSSMSLLSDGVLLLSDSPKLLPLVVLVDESDDSVLPILLFFFGGPLRKRAEPPSICARKIGSYMEVEPEKENRSLEMEQTPKRRRIDVEESKQADVNVRASATANVAAHRSKLVSSQNGANVNRWV